MEVARTMRGESWSKDTEHFLTSIHDEIMDGRDVMAAMGRLCEGLWRYRHDDPEHWHDRATLAVGHPLRRIVHEDPFTRRSFEKPRGYAGDAALLDLIYYDQGYSNVRGVSPVGRDVYRHNRDASAPRAVRERRDHLAALLDRTALRHGGGARVLAVAAGHMREGLKSAALLADAFSEVVAFDQDEVSLKEAGRSLGRRVTPVVGTVRDLLAARWPAAESRFDLIYAAGLLDYLEDRVARTLIARLFDLLAPDGELVVANFVPDIADAGYMETYMGWRLLYRTPEEMERLAPECAVNAASTYFLSRPDICYLALRR